jgi:hypothetical protein
LDGTGQLEVREREAGLDNSVIPGKSGTAGNCIRDTAEASELSGSAVVKLKLRKSATEDIEFNAESSEGASAHKSDIRNSSESVVSSQ